MSIWKKKRKRRRTMTDQQQIDRLIKVLQVYKAHHYPLDLTETEIEIVIDALKTKKNLGEYVARMRDDGR